MRGEACQSSCIQAVPPFIGMARSRGKTNPDGKVWTVSNPPFDYYNCKKKSELCPLSTKDNEEDVKLLQPTMLHGALDTACVTSIFHWGLNDTISLKTFKGAAGRLPQYLHSGAFAHSWCGHRTRQAGLSCLPLLRWGRHRKEEDFLHRRRKQPRRSGTSLIALP